MKILDVDLYQMTMLRAWFYHGMHNKKASMEVFTRKLPKNRSYLIAVGISRIQEILSNLSFDNNSIKLLKDNFPQLKIDEDFENYLLSVDFSKEVELYAMDEGEIFFPHQPILRLEGPIGLIQYVEKMVLSVLNHDVRIASKASRVVYAAKNRPVYELGGRRAHDCTNADVARAAYIAGCAGTSSVLAFKEYGVPAFGSQGHVWIMSFPTEEESCIAWSSFYPSSINLIDTYHSWTGTELAIKHSKKGMLGGIRLDSGDLCEQSINFRRLLNKSDNIDSKIFASDDLNEYKIDKLIMDGAHIDAFGVGTEIVSTPDAPTCGFVCKLVAIEDKPGINRNICKIADSGKGTWPGKKQVWRNYVMNGSAKTFTHDLIGLNNIDPGGMTKPLLGKKELNLTGSFEERKGIMEAARNRFAVQLSFMPAGLKLLENAYEYPVEFSKELINEKARIVQSMRK